MLIAETRTHLLFISVDRGKTILSTDRPLHEVHWFRSAAPYIHAHRNRTFTIAFTGEAIQEPSFPNLIHDIALLGSLGIQLVLVHGARPQIEAALAQRRLKLRYVRGLRVTDNAALPCVKEAVGAVRLEIEALLSMGLPNSPMAGARVRVASGNFITARPLGVREGIDYRHTGEVRKVDVEAIRQRLNNNAIVLLSPLGYSPTGEVFNLSAEDVATASAIALGADKLIFIGTGGLPATAPFPLPRELTASEAKKLLESTPGLPPELAGHLQSAIHACRLRVPRVHIIDQHLDGALLMELFSRDGIGTLVTAMAFEDTRRAAIEDVGGILELIAPLEEKDLLVRRSRERLEMEIHHFTVMERDGTVIGCAALYPFPEEKMGELACLVIHPDYRQSGRATALLSSIEKGAKQRGLNRLCVLTTQTAHWFQERGFEPADLAALPENKRVLYNYQRNSKVFIKYL
ncbi:N-acetylglutamate synthase [Nitrosococcus oceani ATCC 19707]|uniref:Amino-acid acetyltransferase n=1 Tax=Nitrosococcus oceani (strain ATCC 19707 / BCRC 17464 / JCM 30415 / NCIMB 11848 / C-107) TaxID=323261 RepID=Q3J9M2_NITOC|nr:amino-acid N-acetyltransferase [Nitrosococcus oceani]ABA58474.1 N-acetylglutamate synthase [Nitrosococcus oceani ATCC 19707]EDZ67653.1 amino-acid N-acetyltransferase [Nitrosococcus oceani AFC27]